MDDLTCAVGKLLKEECQCVIDKICHLKMLDREDMTEKCLPLQIYFNEKANNVIQKKKRKVIVEFSLLTNSVWGEKWILHSTLEKGKTGLNFVVLTRKIYLMEKLEMTVVVLIRLRVNVGENRRM